MRVLVPMINIILSYRFGHRKYNSGLPVQSSADQLAVAFCLEQIQGGSASVGFGPSID
jgi:hypothetical protein